MNNLKFGDWCVFYRPIRNLRFIPPNPATIEEAITLTNQHNNICNYIFSCKGIEQAYILSIPKQHLWSVYCNDLEFFIKPYLKDTIETDTVYLVGYIITEISICDLETTVKY